MLKLTADYSTGSGLNGGGDGGSGGAIGRSGTDGYIGLECHVREIGYDVRDDVREIGYTI